MKLISALFRLMVKINRRLGSWLRLSFFRLAYYPHLRVGKGVTLERGSYISVTDGGVIELGDRTRICSNTLLVATRGLIAIGKDSFIGRDTCIVSGESITIGDDALIAERVSIRDQNHGAQRLFDQPFSVQAQQAKKICIEGNVWIGAGCFVTSGVDIGKDAVIGANSVVTRSLEGGAIYAGTPAARIRDL